MTIEDQHETDVSLMDRYPIIAGTGAPRTRYQEVPSYAEGLYDLGRQVYAWMVPNGSWGESNAGLIVGEGESLLVDTLWDVNYTREMLEAMHAVKGALPMKTVVNTHADGDHFFGNQLMSEAEIITSQASYDEMLHVQPRSMLLLGRVGKLLSTVRLFGGSQAGHWFQNMVAPYDFAAVEHTLPTRTFTGELTLDIGGRKVQLIEVGPAHTLGDLLVFLPQEKILFSADILFIESTPVMWAGPVDNMLSALDRILEMDVDLIVPGHGPLTDKRGVQIVKDYWLYVKARATQHYMSGLSAQDAAREIVLSDDYQKRPFANWNSPERMMVNVHTLFRHLAGRTDHPGVPELLQILRKQALLAQQLPDAQPAVMRKR
ncbi:MAG: MBL fold metallo-hydrolase [Candidatus Promineifilaceae bacterium]|nr:MBL fold metallo-hydrolase [Candidatus Promineifilaceae bacterium]